MKTGFIIVQISPKRWIVAETTSPGSTDTYLAITDGISYTKAVIILDDLRNQPIERWSSMTRGGVKDVCKGKE